MLKKQKGMILMYLGIFVAVAWLVAGQGQKNEENSFKKRAIPLRCWIMMTRRSAVVLQPIWEKNTNRWKSGTMKN